LGSILPSPNSHVRVSSPFPLKDCCGLRTHNCVPTPSLAI
jgi:hypothetical protein